MRAILYFLICFSLIDLYGQKDIDSLHLLLEQKDLSDKVRTDVLNDLGYEYWIIDTKKSIEYGGDALELAKKLSYKSGIARSGRVIGVAYWAQGNPKQALENLTSSQAVYESIGNNEGLANCLLNTGMVYADIKEYTKAEELYEKAIEKFTILNLKGRIATTYTKMADIFLAQNNLYDAKEFLDNALSIHSENDFTYGRSEVHNRLGRLFIEEGELEQAEYHIRQSTILGKEAGDEDGKISNLILFGELLRLKNEFETSEIHLNLALVEANKKDLKKYRLAALRELQLLKKQQGEFAESLNYYDDYIVLKDSIYNTDKSKQIAAIEFSNELQEKDRQLRYLNESKKADTYIKWLLITGISIISLLSFFLIKSLRSKNKNQQKLLTSIADLNKKELENQRLKQIDLENQLHFKNKELTSYALNFVQKNELLENLYSKLKEVREATPGNQIKYLKEIEHTIKQHKNLERDWEDFKVHFEQVHSDFLKILKDKYPELSGNDLKVAALTRLNLSIKETSGILGISPESAKTARYRLRKKLKMSQEEDLFSFLSEVEKGD
ncbi:tetratricopeptide repeat protein [Galbibacter sp. EGI 63066]|uniref:tetratricopeptide repeat protein n=1 Tax=Galbibacter sp. EGI 63066 TaxID=2993559 RepID=UPI00224942FB|nr:tetratricopeptide repeat protein [Galbibacter sp. EGI 63066]MCX2679274.1 tetratricopeptide repeat protein [Galbibacter sp. EGI 63066]